MRKLISIVALAVASQFALAPVALAATPQQQRMADCNKEATGKTGDERKTFMKSCLSGKQEEAKVGRTAQQQKMKLCNAEAGKKSLKGDPRKAFMKECLSN
jgi:hypothetical protein